MCDPSSAIAAMGLILSAAGTAYSVRESNSQAHKAEQESARALTEQLEMQDRFRDAAGVSQKRTLEDTAEASSAPALAALTAPREEFLTGNLSTSAPGSAMVSSSAPDVVNTEIAQKLHEAVQKGTQQAQALAKIGARSDAALYRGLALQEGRSNLGDILSMSAGTANLFPGQLAGALNNLGSPSAVGPLASGLGGAALGGAYSGLFDPKKPAIQPTTQPKVPTSGAAAP